MKTTGYVCLAALLGAATLPGQTRKLEQGPNRMELTLERHASNSWKVVDPGTVFANGDKIRFRFKTNFSGYLYVMNQGTGGSYMQLFPSAQAGMENRIEAGREYYVPATSEGSFKVDGPPGQDIVYWVVSPGPMDANNYKPLPPPPSKVKPGDLIPRCDDAILRARGECIDSTAGAKPVARGQDLPDNIQKSGAEPKQDLVFMKNQGKSVVSAPSKLMGPVVYEYRLAHK